MNLKKGADVRISAFLINYRGVIRQNAENPGIQDTRVFRRSEKTLYNWKTAAKFSVSDVSCICGRMVVTYCCDEMH
jgi:hypothetical protein